MANGMRRMMSVWLPTLPTDRLARRHPASEPRVIVADDGGVLRLTALDAAAARLGLAPGQTLADARALVPSLDARPADPAADAACLDRLAAWCTRWTPWTAADGADGLWLDITGCPHLFGGEEALRDDVLARLGRLGFAARAAIADTPGAARAIARFAADRQIVPAGESQAALDKLPPAALRLSAATVAALDGLGLRRIGDLHDLPRAGLAVRFGDEITRRLDQALGRLAEPISPRRPVAPWRTLLAFAEPIATPEDIARVTRHLLIDLCARLAAVDLGARRLDLVFYKADGGIAALAAGMSRPTRVPDRLLRLFAERFETVDPGFGIEAAALEATLVEALLPAQLAFASRMDVAAAQTTLTGEPDFPDLAPLIDRLANRLGPHAVSHFELQESHLPERAVRHVRAGSTPDNRIWRVRFSSPFETHAPIDAVGVDSLSRGPGDAFGVTSLRDGPTGLLRMRSASRRTHAPQSEEAASAAVSNHEAADRAARPPPYAAGWSEAPPRPLRLLGRPEPIEVIAPVPDDPPILFRWRRVPHRIARADGPERIAPEWWRQRALPRDYYRIEDAEGRRFWVFREGLYQASPLRWFLHGLFA
ncbi:MAG: DNA polymerase Y family protein [Proteobacteria bacterium]|nr:DNA polymerase Y family protein [Pseudomonadota bacterium]